MQVFEIVVAMLVVGSVLALIARRIGAPYPALVALAGIGLAFVPGLPTLELDPDLTLTLFVAPVLADAAYNSSPRDLRANWRPVASLALGAVALTILVVAAAAKLLVPDMSWGAAVALGAIVAPPDAAAAAAVLKHLRPPHRLLVILEGESLFNDASALLVYRFAVIATVTGFLSSGTVAPTLLGITAGSLVLGYILARLTLSVLARIKDVETTVVLQFCGSFGVWILAEQLHLSGIITVVVYAMTASRHAPKILPARLRIPSWAVWGVAVFVLNVLAFILVGFQLKGLAERISGETAKQYAAVAGIICLVAILARLAWVIGAAAVSRWRFRRRADRSLEGRSIALSSRAAVLVGWCGMRGTVTLAAALALPSGSNEDMPFPHRDLIIVAAFGVVAGTLVLQGLTLRPLLVRLGLEDDGSTEREVRLGRAETLRSAVAAASECAQCEMTNLVRDRYALQLRRAEEDIAQADTPTSIYGSAGAASRSEREVEAAAVRSALEAQRGRLLALRADGTIGETAFQRLEEELDWLELGWAQLLGGTLESAGHAEATKDGFRILSSTAD